MLEISNLTKYYGDTLALKDVSLKVKRGEFVAVIGRSGAGKSTLLRCVNRMIEPSSGLIRFEGSDVRALKRANLRSYRTRIGMIFQHFNLVPRQTVIENVLHGRLGHKSAMAGVVGAYSADEKRMACSLLEELNLSELAARRCDQLSGGQKQRVGIARALIQEPRLILCDEPIASLDPRSAKTIMDLLKDVAEKKEISILINLHQVDVAVRYADRVIGIREGHLVYDGDPHGLKKKTLGEIYGSSEDDILCDEAMG
jgi:phosphonate transport system ATP-binding protein